MKVCDKCHGVGYIYDNPCEGCTGAYSIIENGIANMLQIKSCKETCERYKLYIAKHSREKHEENGHTDESCL